MKSKVEELEELVSIKDPDAVCATGEDVIEKRLARGDFQLWPHEAKLLLSEVRRLQDEAKSVPPEALQTIAARMGKIACDLTISELIKIRDSFRGTPNEVVATVADAAIISLAQNWQKVLTDPIMAMWQHELAEAVITADAGREHQ